MPSASSRARPPGFPSSGPPGMMTIAGLMLLSGLRSAEVLGLRVADVDIGWGWVRVTGKGDQGTAGPARP